MTVHVIGAGLAGLAAAVRLTLAGRAVRLYEAAPRAGGRCRSYFEPRLGCTIDNGGHIILGGNAATLAYIDAIGSRAELLEMAPARIPFLDLTTGERWLLRPSAGPIPWWLLAPSRRLPGARLADQVRLVRLLAARPHDVVTDCVDPSAVLYRRLIEPLATAIMNTLPEQAAARPLARVLRATLLRGERACRPMIARRGLSFALVDPALAWLERHGARYEANARAEQLAFADGRLASICVNGATFDLHRDDAVILATPSWVAADLVPGLLHPTAHCAIANAHFRLKWPAGLDPPLLGLVGGAAQWLIARDDVVSVTVSAADALLDEDSEALLDRLWHDTAKALACEGPRPPARLIKEKRATFRQTPAAEAQRPQARTAWANLFLAGDWTATGLPATIEGAIRSGYRAADAATQF
ncbi:MAG TPA: hydroxysqualene dehydroxylase HpnE [Alphaproteobacteria bacterium]|nr:hydroxysqualene dehydroxylase HpnE [Alphaproteobacteria bacterium]